MPNPPGANPLVAERAFPTSDDWGRTGVARCAEEMTGICRDSNRLLTPVTQDCEDLQRGLSATRGLAPGGLGTRQLMSACNLAAPYGSSCKETRREIQLFEAYPLDSEGEAPPSIYPSRCKRGELREDLACSVGPLLRGIKGGGPHYSKKTRDVLQGAHSTISILQTHHQNDKK